MSVIRRRLVSPTLVAIALAAVSATSVAQRRSAPATPPAAPAMDTSTFRALQWRNVGPFRGGRANAGAGIPTQPLTYFAGYTGGGLWRTDDAGINWRNISDGFFRTGSIGAIAVAPSDPNVIYVGTGEARDPRAVVDLWRRRVSQHRSGSHLDATSGCAATRQISAVRVHPTDPECGVRRGAGRSVEGQRRARDLSHRATAARRGRWCSRARTPPAVPVTCRWTPTNPRILYAAFWDHQRTPWMVRSGGAGSGIWKSIDGGDSWTRLTEGLPKLMGKIGVAVSPANPDRVYAIVEAENGGLYRSDDAGQDVAPDCPATA